MLSLVLLCRISHRHYSKIFHREFPHKIKYFFTTRICRHGHANLSFPEIFGVQISSKITKNNSRGIIFVIISCQRVFYTVEARHTRVCPRDKPGAEAAQKVYVTKVYVPFSQGPPNGGGFKRGGFPIWTCPSFFVLFCPFWDFPDFSGIFPICSGMVQGFSRFVLFLFLGLLRAPTRNIPERVRDTIWTFPEKSGKHPGLETPRFSFSQFSLANLGDRKANKLLKKVYDPHLLGKNENIYPHALFSGNLG